MGAHGSSYSDAHACYSMIIYRAGLYPTVLLLLLEWPDPISAIVVGAEIGPLYRALMTTPFSRDQYSYTGRARDHLVETSIVDTGDHELI